MNPLLEPSTGWTALRDQSLAMQLWRMTVSMREIELVRIYVILVTLSAVLLKACFPLHFHQKASSQRKTNQPPETPPALELVKSGPSSGTWTGSPSSITIPLQRSATSIVTSAPLVWQSGRPNLLLLGKNAQQQRTLPLLQQQPVLTDDCLPAFT